MESLRRAVFSGEGCSKAAGRGRCSPDLRGVGDRASRKLFGLRGRAAVVRLAAALFPVLQRVDASRDPLGEPRMRQVQEPTEHGEVVRFKRSCGKSLALRTGVHARDIGFAETKTRKLLFSKKLARERVMGFEPTTVSLGS